MKLHFAAKRSLINNLNSVSFDQSTLRLGFDYTFVTEAGDITIGSAYERHWFSANGGNEDVTEPKFVLPINPEAESWGVFVGWSVSWNI